MIPLEFHYTPSCSAPGCSEPAEFKVAASWSDGKSWELKNYGLACQSHRDSQLARGRMHRQGLVLVEGEVVGEVALFELRPSTRDAALVRVPDHGA